MSWISNKLVHDRSGDFFGGAKHMWALKTLCELGMCLYYNGVLVYHV